MKRKINYIIGMIWLRFRKKKVERRLFERIRFVDKHSVGLDNDNVRIELFLLNSYVERELMDIMKQEKKVRKLV